MTPEARAAKNAYQRAYNRRNKEKVAERNRRYREKNKEKIKAINERYWERKAAEAARGDA